MAIKYKLKLRDLKLEYLIEYFKPILKYLKPKEKTFNFLVNLDNNSIAYPASHWRDVCAPASDNAIEAY